MESIYNKSRIQLGKWFIEQGEKPHWADDLWPFLYKDKRTSFSAMPVLPPRIANLLETHFQFDGLQLTERQESVDGTIKYLFRLADGGLIETVLMDHDFGASVCVTSQVGCNMGCKFCASGLLSKQRDLTPAEIVGQILGVEKDLQDQGKNVKVSHVVIMGIGEPFDNYDHVLEFLNIAMDQKGLALAGRHITLSTSGVAQRIYDFADANLPVNLALSLHAPNEELRKKIMPITHKYSLAKVMEAITYYIKKTGRKVTFEYILIKDFNDGPDEAKELIDLLKPFGKAAVVNLIPYNPVTENEFSRSTQEATASFFDALMAGGIYCIRRKERGSDIEAACGQLRSKRIKNPGKTDFVLDSNSIL